MKKFAALTALILSVTLLTGCQYSYQISEMAYVVAIGIDTGEAAPYRFTYQFARPLAVAGGEEGSGGGGEEGGSTSVSAEATDMFSALNIVGNVLSKQVNLSHMKLLLFSSEVASEDIRETVRFLMKNSQTRPDTYAAVAAGRAEEYLRAVKPSLEVNPAKYYSLIFSKKNSNYIPAITLRDLYSHIHTEGQEAALPLVGVRTDENPPEGEGAQQAAIGNYKAGEGAAVSDSVTEVSGMALLHMGTLVGTLPSRSAELYRMCTGDFRPSYYHIPSEAAEGDHIVLNLRPAGKPRYEIQVSDTPRIRLSVAFRAQMVKCPPEEYAAKDVEGLNRMAEQNIRADIEQFLAQTAAYGTDVVGFGRHAKRHFASYPDWEAYDWGGKYPHASFQVDVSVNIDNDGLIHSVDINN